MLASLITWDDRQLGFDPTVFYPDQNMKLHILTQEPFKYIVEETLVRSYTIRSRGSTCWRVRKVDDEESSDARYLIQDSWVEGGMITEQTILQKIHDTQVKNGIAGVASLVHIENIHIQQGDHVYPDTVKSHRRDNGIVGIDDLIHTRTVSRCHGRDCTRLENFTSPKELIYALHDVIK